ncbi:hypothetical protein GF360_03205 [candidate division WWE3 bacterium]|nr:hypothetical protein [candidate division WWE3 bacterium]
MIQGIGAFLKSNKNILGIFAITLLIYLINLPIDYSKSLQTKVPRRLLTSNDVTSATFLPYEVIKNKTLRFSKSTVDAMQRAQVYEPFVYSVINKNGKFLSAMPILAGIMAIPIYIIPILLNKIPALQYYKDLVNILTLGRIAASFYTAISVAIFFLILKEIDKIKNFKTNAWNYAFVAFFAFGTNVYSIASRALYQHTSSLLFVTLIIYFALKSLKDDNYVKYLGLFAGFLYLARPLNLVFVALLTVYVFFMHKKEFVKYLLYALPTALLLFAYNIYAWGNPLTTEYVEKSDTSFSTPLIVGLSGYLFSPARSFLFVTPPLVVGYFAMIRTFIKRNKEKLDILLITLSATFLIVLILYSKWHDWEGGDRFGYGFLTEWVPVMAVLSYIYIKPMKRLGKVIIGVLMLWSVVVQTNAVWIRKSRCSGASHNWSFYCITPQFFKKQNY